MNERHRLWKSWDPTLRTKCGALPPHSCGVRSEKHGWQRKQRVHSLKGARLGPDPKPKGNNNRRSNSHKSKKPTAVVRKSTIILGRAL